MKLCLRSSVASRPPSAFAEPDRRELRCDLQSADRLALDCEAVLQVYSTARKVALQMHTRKVLSVTRGLDTNQLRGVLVDRRGICAPRSDLVRSAPGLILVEDDGIVGKQREQSVEVAG